MKKILIATLLMFSLSSAFAAPDNVYGKGDQYIKVSLNEDRTGVKFELYSKKNNKKIRTLGEENKFYKISALKELARSEKNDVVLSSLAAVGLVLATSGVGYVLTYEVMAVTAASGAIIHPTTTSLVIGTGASAGIGAKLASITNSLNPYEQYKQLETLSDDVINGKDFHTKTKISKFAKRLELLLDKIYWDGL